MCLGQVEQVTSSARNTRDNVNSLFGWGNNETRGNPRGGSITNVYNYGNKTKSTETKTPKRSSLNTKGGNY